MDVRLPDGTLIQGVPDGMSKADLVVKLKGNGYDTSKLEAPAPVAPLSRSDKVLQGMRDPIDGGVQLLTHLLPKSVVDAGNAANNWLADKTGLVAKLPEGGVDEQIKTNEAQYQARRRAPSISSLVTGQQEDPGFDGYRLGGNLLSPVTLGLGGAGVAAKGATLLTRAGLGAAGGASSGALSPVVDGGDFATEKAKQMATGAGFGAAAAPIGGALARLVSPKASTSASLNLLKAEGVQPSLGQTLGGLANNLEEKATSVPIVGNMIRNARMRGVEGMNEAAFNRALAPVGEKLPAGMAGREAVEHVGDLLGQKYDTLLPKMTTQMDGGFVNQVQSLRNMMSTGSIAPAEAAQFEKILQSQVLGKFQGQTPTITGETLKDIQRNLGELSSKFARDPSADKQMLGEALGEVRKEVLEMAGRAHPQHATELKAIDTGYANFKRVQKAAAGLGAEEGVFSPAQLQSAVKAADRSKDKGNFAKGDALMQDLTEAGKKVLGDKVPDSGTAGRGAAMGLAVGLPAILAAIKGAPVAAATAALTPLAYTKSGQNLLRAAVSARPELAEPVANALRKSSPALGAGLGQIGANALN